ncbi:MAG: hypothetical protein ABI758_06530 [Candidatus Woesebacteria bacterium]
MDNEQKSKISSILTDIADELAAPALIVIPILTIGYDSAVIFGLLDRNAESIVVAFLLSVAGKNSFSLIKEKYWDYHERS